ncbi:hypothetical protein PT974_08722 [Cladobotryum mycophilum]|uniref:Chitin synthesis regulation, Congo red resistance, RCR protein n=1 Tax=Cladobotryum mycophilum TaxID=491253 RepID=A0ABR0SEQ8_9HYPO
MAPTEELVARDYLDCSYGFYNDGYRCSRRSSWYFWGRWVVAGIIIVIALIFILGCICYTRRQRKRGVRPMGAAGWLGGGNKHAQNNQGHEMNNYQAGYPQGGGYEQNQQYGGGYQGGFTSPPPYGQPQPQPMGNHTTGTTFNPNDGYYTGQQYGVQPPPNAYQPDHTYPPK